MNKSKIELKTNSYQESLIESLRDPKEAEMYLQVAFEEYQEDGNFQAFLLALRNVTQATGGISELAKRSHLNRQNLYRTLSSDGNPRLDTLGAIMKGLGFSLSIQRL